MDCCGVLKNVQSKFLYLRNLSNHFEICFLFLVSKYRIITISLNNPTLCLMEVCPSNRLIRSNMKNRTL